MKKGMLFIAALGICLNGFSQSVEWFHSSAKWNFQIQSGWIGSGIEQIRVEGDSLLNGKTYKKLARKAHFQPSGIESNSVRLARQVGRKVLAHSDVLGNEFLMYDFDLAAGDTVKIPLTSFGQTGLAYVIESVKTIAINGLPRISQDIKWLPGNTYLIATNGSFIEGIGCVEGLHLIGGVWCLSESYLFVDEPGTIVVDGESRIFCSFENALLQFEGLGQSFCAALATGSPEAGSLKIYPNPSDGSIQIEGFENRSAALTVELFDAFGRLVESKMLADDGRFSTDFKGLGILLIQTENGAMRQKVVFQ